MLINQESVQLVMVELKIVNVSCLPRSLSHPAPQGDDGARRLLGHGDNVQLHDGGVVRRHQHGLTRLHPLQHRGLRGRRTLLLRDSARPSGATLSK